MNKENQNHTEPESKVIQDVSPKGKLSLDNSGSPNNYEDACYCKPLKDLWDNEEDEIWNNIDTQNYEEELKKGCGLLMFGCVDKTGKTIACGELNHLCSECKAKLEGFQKAKEHYEDKLKKIKEKIKNSLFKHELWNKNHGNGMILVRGAVQKEISKIFKKELEKKE